MKVYGPKSIGRGGTNILLAFIIFPSDMMKIIVLCYIYPGITILTKWCLVPTAHELRAI